MAKWKVVYASYRSVSFDAPIYQDTLRSLAAPDFEVQTVPFSAGEEALKAAVADADFLIGFPPATADVLAAAKKLKLVQIMGAGYDYMDVEAAKRLGIPVANNTGANSTSVAEHAIMLILATLKSLERLAVSTRAGRWGAGVGDDEIHELEGKIVGIVGFGNIGRGVARRLQGWDVTLRYYDEIRQPQNEHLATYLPLDDLLREADVVTVHTPLTDATHHLIGERALRLMKPTAIIVNTSRGPTVDERALYEALSSGRLAGAGLDVWADEPTDPNNPLLTLPNVIATPHVAGVAFETWARRCEYALDNFRRVLAGQEPLRRVA